MIDLLIVYQSHAQNESVKKRYVGESKPEISRRCFLSLIDSIKYCIKRAPADIQINLIVLDDRSNEHFLNLVRKTAYVSSFNIELINSDVQGVMPNIRSQFKLGLEKGKQLVYFAQDDYLYYENAIYEMIDSYFNFCNIIGNSQICIYPFDDPYRYNLNYIKDTCRVLRGGDRHWKNSYYTASCFMMPHSTLVENWELFEEMGSVEHDEFCEDKSINRLFRNFHGLPKREINHLLFTPLTSLALHLESDFEKDSFLDWKELWGKYDNANKQVELPKGKIAINLGSGNSKLSDMGYTEDLTDYIEVTVDLDPKSNPDICADMRDLSIIPESTIDLIYSSHSLEHVAFHDVKTCLIEWFRVIKPGGEIRIIVPNLKKIFEFVRDGNILDKVYDSECGPISAIDMIYGYRKFIYYGNDFMQHKTGFTKESAETILVSLRFTHFTVFELDTDLMIRLFKPLG